MSDLAEFLLARIAEDETVSREFVERWGDDPDTSGHRADVSIEYAEILVSGGRFAAECAAKRRVVEFLRPTPDMPEGEGRFVAESTLLLLAMPYANHPDFAEAVAAPV